MLPKHTHVTTLLQLLIQRYFSQLSSVLIVHGGDGAASGEGVGVKNSALQLEYLEVVQLAFRNLSQQGRVIGLQWIDVSQLNGIGSSNSSEASMANDSCSQCDDSSDYDDELGLHLLRAVDILTQGFITILSDTVRFLHARYYATRYAHLRLKDKFYLFLCENENPEDLLSNELLQFYPHHLMVIPEASTAVQTENPKSKSNGVSYKRYATKPTTKSESTTPILEKFNIAKSPSPAQHDNNIQLWTQKYVGTHGNLDALLLDAFLPNETFIWNAELFPNKIKNMRGRSVRVGSVTYIPYVVTNYVPAGTGNANGLESNSTLTVSYYGSEAEIVKTFCILHNCSLRVKAYGTDFWGYIYKNGSSIGNMGDIYTQTIELAIGCIYNWYNDITEISTFISRSAVTMLGPAPPLFPAWRATIMPFSGKLWFFLVMTVLLCALVMYIIRFTAFVLDNWRWNQRRHFEHMGAISQAILDMTAVFIQQPSGPTSLQTFAGRFFLSTILCATITLENTYSGQLKSLLTVPLATEPVNTIEKWSKTDWLWYAPSVMWVTAIEKSKSETIMKMFKLFEERDHAYMYNASFRSDIGLGIERLISGTFTFEEYVTKDVLDSKIVLEDDLYYEWTRGVSIKGWPLMEYFSKHARACMESGLYLYWEKEVTSKYLDRQTEEIIFDLANGYVNKSPPQNLNLENISGALFALLIGCLIGTIVFVLELVVHNACKQKWLVVNHGNN